MTTQEPRVVLITGSSRGIGLAAAVAFARLGDHVIATMRDLTAADALRVELATIDPAPSVDIVALDVTDQASVDRAFREVFDKHGRIDVLINNAGVGHQGSLEQLTLEDFQQSMDVNFFGVVRTTLAVFAGMREQRSGRIINVSSVAGSFGQPFNDAYCAAKHALEGLSESLCPVARQFGVFVSVVEPGPVSSDFTHRGIGSGQTPSHSPYAPLRAAYDAMMAGNSSNAASPKDIAQTIVDVANNPEPPARVQTPEWIAKLIGSKLKDLSGERVVGITSKWLQG